MLGVEVRELNGAVSKDLTKPTGAGNYESRK
jgi:hypothetical protein